MYLFFFSGLLTLLESTMFDFLFILKKKRESSIYLWNKSSSIFSTTFIQFRGESDRKSGFPTYRQFPATKWNLYLDFTRCFNIHCFSLLYTYVVIFYLLVFIEYNEFLIFQFGEDVSSNMI